MYDPVKIPILKNLKISKILNLNYCFYYYCCYLINHHHYCFLHFHHLQLLHHPHLHHLNHHLIRPYPSMNHLLWNIYLRILLENLDFFQDNSSKICLFFSKIWVLNISFLIIECLFIFEFKAQICRHLQKFCRDSAQNAHTDNHVKHDLKISRHCS